MLGQACAPWRTAAPLGVLALIAVPLVAGCGTGREAGLPVSGTRAGERSSISAATIPHLHLRWRFRLPTLDTFSGVDTATPVVAGGVVYLQDMRSDVYALDRKTGALLWRRRFGREDGGPNGVAVLGKRVFGNTDTSTFALDARTGRVLWLRHLTSPKQPIGIAPVAANGLVYTSTLGLPPGGKGTIVALDQRTGQVRWRFVTIRDPWAVPSEAGGGGLWWPVSVDGNTVYAGNSNPYPWGGTKQRPNGGAYRGRALYTDSLLALDGHSGTLLWYDQVVPHDVRDYDFAVTPVLTTASTGDTETKLVIGAGKGGRVIAWDRRTRRRVWDVPVGVHEHDRGPLPTRRVRVCPGLLGGVLTPMASAEGRVFVPVVDLCMRGSATGYQRLETTNYTRGKGELVALSTATGRTLWIKHFPSPDFGCATVADDVVFTATYDGRIYGLSARDGSTLWTAQAPAGVNACPTVDGDLLLVGAGADSFLTPRPVHELLAFTLG